MSNNEVSDPTDWTTTALPFLTPFDAGLRCQVCKDFFTAAVITACSHTFCSLCIRRCLAAEGKCPTCRANEQEVRLRRNVAVQELTDVFVTSRVEALNIARERQNSVASESSLGGPNDRKRKRSEISGNRQASNPQSRRRSQRLRSASQPLEEDLPPDAEASKQRNKSNQDDGDYEPEDGLVSCPICHTRMKAEAVFEHLDRCEGEQSAPNHKSSRSSKPPARSQTATPASDHDAAPPRPPPERLPQINYSLLKDNALRKKLSDINISNSGPRALLIRRHTEWTNLWNANCDSARPRSRRELLRDLDAWERSQGSLAANGGQPTPSAVMNKDFDGNAWAQQNKDDFDQLISLARKKKEQATKTNSTNLLDSAITPLSIGTLTSTPSAPTTITNPPMILAPTPQIPLGHTIERPSTAQSNRSHASTNGTSSRRGSVQWPDAGPPSIFSPPHPSLDLQRTATRSPVPGFSFEKSVAFGGREAAPARAAPQGVVPVPFPASFRHQSSVSSAISDGASSAGTAKQSDTRDPVFAHTQGESDGSKRKKRMFEEDETPLAGTRQLPMFEVPGIPVEDAEMGETK